MRIDIDVSASGNVLADIERRARDFKPGLRLIGDDLRDQMDEVFRRRGARRAWDALDQYYAAHKPGGRPVGVFTGTLRRSLTDANGRYAIDEVTANRLVVGSRAPHAGFFHKGRGGQPARPVIPPLTQTARRAGVGLTLWLASGRSRFDGVI